MGQSDASSNEVGKLARTVVLLVEAAVAAAAAERVALCVPLTGIKAMYVR